MVARYPSRRAEKPQVVCLLRSARDQWVLGAGVQRLPPRIQAPDRSRNQRLSEEGPLSEIKHPLMELPFYRGIANCLRRRSVVPTTFSAVLSVIGNFVSSVDGVVRLHEIARANPGAATYSRFSTSQAASLSGSPGNGMRRSWWVRYAFTRRPRSAYSSPTRYIRKLGTFMQASGPRR